MLMQVLPLKNGVKSDDQTELELLVRIVPQPGPEHAKRPDLNLSLVLDQSTSMTGAKLNQTLTAASKVIEYLSPTDRLSVVLFDDRVQVLIPTTYVTDPTAMRKLLGCVKAGGSTALHAGWVEGATQVALKLNPKAINRVLVLTDGQANVGEVNPDKIASDVNGLAQRGVSTTTLGFGSDFNEILLRSMAASGNGNNYFIEHPSKLGGIFDLEIGNLVSTLGTNVRMTIESPGEAVVLTRLIKDDDGLRLNDLIEDNPITVLLRVQVPAGRSPQASINLKYLCMDTKLEKTVSLNVELPSMSSAKWKALPEQPEVMQELALWEANNCRMNVAGPLMAGDIAGVQQILGGAVARLKKLPPSELIERHLKELEEVLQDVASNDYAVANKRLVQQERAYSYSSVSMGGDPRMRLLKKLAPKGKD